MGASICRWMQAGSKRTSLVVQWLRIHLPMQGTQVRSLVSKLGSNILQGDQAHVPQLLSPRALEPARHD